uniref:Uncharacterized protein n=1 Tax=Anguilla anguilla TaxID=7936 RepID=A0A0E9X8I5_ANGAN
MLSAAGKWDRSRLEGTPSLPPSFTPLPLSVSRACTGCVSRLGKMLSADWCFQHIYRFLFKVRCSCVNTHRFPRRGPVCFELKLFLLMEFHPYGSKSSYTLLRRK